MKSLGLGLAVFVALTLGVIGGSTRAQCFGGGGGVGFGSQVQNFVVGGYGGGFVQPRFFNRTQFSGGRRVVSDNFGRLFLANRNGTLRLDRRGRPIQVDRNGRVLRGQSQQGFVDRGFVGSRFTGNRFTNRGLNGRQVVFNQFGQPVFVKRRGLVGGILARLGF